MADLTQTITNTLTLIGLSPANEWGSFNWGENWGSDNDTNFEIGKWLSETTTFTDSIFKGSTTARSEAIAFTSALNLVALRDANGYIYIEKGASDPDDRLFPSYTEQSGSEPTYTQQTGSSPSWSDA